MDKSISFVSGLGLGAGLMYILDPQLGQRRRAFVQKQAANLANDPQEALEAVGKDVRKHAQGVASGNFGAMAGGWSPSARTLMTGLGAGLFLLGLTQNAPTACVLGTIGLALAAEGVTNLGVEDITEATRSLQPRSHSAQPKRLERQPATSSF
jgi:hypothetical protein